MFIWDDKKSESNKIKHGIPFDAVYDFNWETSTRVNRSRLNEDGEARLAEIGWLYGKLHTIIFTYRADALRIISLRRANKGEEKIHDQEN